jgi:hypothetical protein
MADRIDQFIAYHDISYRAQDIDPSYPMLRYVCDRFELNMEQRYWLAFLYATTYCGATVYYIYNEFPDLAGVDLNRMERWWAAHRSQLVFQTDNRWIRSRNQFVDVVASYRELLRGCSQEVVYQWIAYDNQHNQGRDDDERQAIAYDNCFEYFSGVKWFGRFRLFLLLEAVHVVAGFHIEPTGLPLRDAESSRNGLAYALGYDHLLTGGDSGRVTLNDDEFTLLSEGYESLLDSMRQRLPGQRIDAWNVETTLCAYKKWHRGGKRYPGYYLDRQHHEIATMEANVTDGVAWRALWEFRRETFDNRLLREITGHDNQGVLWPRSK